MFPATDEFKAQQDFLCRLRGSCYLGRSKRGEAKHEKRTDRHRNYQLPLLSPLV